MFEPVLSTVYLKCRPTMVKRIKYLHLKWYDVNISTWIQQLTFRIIHIHKPVLNFWRSMSTFTKTILAYLLGLYLDSPGNLECKGERSIDRLVRNEWWVHRTWGAGARALTTTTTALGLSARSMISVDHVSDEACRSNRVDCEGVICGPGVLMGPPPSYPPLNLCWASHRLPIRHTFMT